MLSIRDSKVALLSLTASDEDVEPVIPDIIVAIEEEYCSIRSTL